MVEDLNYGYQIDFSDVNDLFDDFMCLYEERPVQNNIGGMLSTHLFWTWYICTKLSPKYIIESGVYKGQGTWVLRQACPKAEIFSIDPDLSNRIYVDEKATYFIDDFSLIKWDDFINEKERRNILCFFDDHQNAYQRLMEMRWMGFYRAMFDDNYPMSRGDCYSIKKVLAETGFHEDLKTGSDMVPANTAHSFYFKKNIASYITLPPLVKMEYTRWGDKWDEDNYPTGTPILSDINKKKYPVISKEASSYNWICLVELM